MLLCILLYIHGNIWLYVHICKFNIPDWVLNWLEGYWVFKWKSLTLYAPLEVCIFVYMYVCMFIIAFRIGSVVFLIIWVLAYVYIIHKYLFVPFLLLLYFFCAWMYWCHFYVYIHVYFNINHLLFNVHVQLHY